MSRVYDIVNLDNSLLNHELRYIYLNIIKGFVIVSIKYENNANYLEWIIKKEMYIRNIFLSNTNMLQSSSLSTIMYILENLIDVRCYVEYIIVVYLIKTASVFVLIQRNIL